MEKQTIYVLLASGAFCILFLLYIISSHNQYEKIHRKNDELKSLKFDKFEISLKKRFDHLYENYKIKYYLNSRVFLPKDKKERTSLVWMDVYPKYTVPNLNNNINFTVNWRSTNTSLADNSWIGIYPYGEKTDIFNCLNYFYLNKLIASSEKIPIPNQAGYFDIRYIQDNNKKTLATNGPILVNPKDSFIKVTNEENHFNNENSDIFNNFNYNEKSNIDIETEKENSINLRNIKNYQEEDKLNIEWSINGTTLENLINKIFDQNKKKEEIDIKTEESYLNTNDYFNHKSKSENNKIFSIEEKENLKNKKKFIDNDNIEENFAQINLNEKSKNKMKNIKSKNLIDEQLISNIDNDENDYKDSINLNQLEIILKTQKLNVYICLTILGSTDSNECLWKKRLENFDSLKGKDNLNLPKIAGYFYFRIYLEKDFKFYESKDFNIVVSKIFKISSKKFILLPDNLDSVVGSHLSISWSSSDPEKGDWIGLYNLGDIQYLTKSLTPIKTIKITEDNAFFGNANAFISNNKEAGQFVFIYFRDFKPISISDLIEIQQPRVSCPNNDYYLKSNKLNKDIYETLFGLITQNKDKKLDDTSTKSTNKTIENKISISERIKLLKNLPQFTQSKIKHLVIICTENHSFDSYMGEYCKSEVFSNPKCNYGPECCEKPPIKLNGIDPFVLNDTQNLKFDPNHNQYCELCEINNGKMDGYVKGCSCSDPQNFAVADKQTVKILHDYARNYSLADNFFQPNAGGSSQNDMYFARAAHVFIDNRKISVGSIGSNCWYTAHFLLEEFQVYYDPTITHLLSHCNFTLRTYAEGYDIAKKNFTGNPCYPFGYDSSDIPFNYYAGVLDKPNHIQDYLSFEDDISNKTLPEVSFIKPLGIKTSHPSFGKISDELNFVKETVDMILNDEYYYDNTLILYVPDESGGYYDHVSPPPTNIVDEVPYGPRIPVLAIGKFAKKNYISHVTMEHSSIVKFIEWNWLNGETGQLNVRDKNVNSIGDLIDPSQAGTIVP